MKKTMKTLLALALGVAMGSSAWADNVKQAVTLNVGDTSATYEMTYGTKTNQRWWKLAVKDGADSDPSEAVASATFTSANPEEPRMTSSGTPAEVKCYFKALTVGTVKYVAYTFTDAPPYTSGKSYPAYAKADGKSGSWSSGSGNDFTITVNDLPRTDGLTAGPVDSGTKLSAISTSSIQGKIVDSNGTTVQGTLAWKDGTTEVAVGENTYKVTFTPTGTLAQYFGSPTNFNVTIVGNAPWKLVENPVIVKATRVTFSDNQTKTETQYDGFLTEKGCQYAWGKDGSPTTAWTEPSDGTPCDISAKPGDATQLFMKDPTK